MFLGRVELILIVIIGAIIFLGPRRTFTHCLNRHRCMVLEPRRISTHCFNRRRGMFLGRVELILNVLIGANIIFGAT